MIKKYPDFEQIKKSYPMVAKFLMKMNHFLPKWTVHRYQIDYLKIVENEMANDRNTLITMPTGMGKTMALFYATLIGRTIYVSPSVALTNEKYIEIPDKFPTYKVLRDTGSDRTARRDSPELFKYEDQDLIVTTNERLKYMIIGNDRDRIFDGIEYIVFDEIHKIGNIGRGAALEEVIMLLKKFFPKKTLIGLSATLPNYVPFADWLNAGIYYRPSEDRPVPLVFKYGKPIGEWLRKAADKREAKFAQFQSYAKFLDGQFLIFMNSKSFEFGGIDYYASRMASNILGDEMHNMDVSRMADAEVGKHYRGLPEEYQLSVIKDFNAGKIKYLFCTTTLAEGVNMAATNCVVFDFSFWNKLTGQHEPNKYDQITQIVGRAGRPNMGIDEGRAIFLGDKSELLLAKDYMDNPKPVNSQFGRVIVDKILTMIATKQGNTIEELESVIKESFFVYQIRMKEGFLDTKALVTKNVDLLMKYSLVKLDRNGLFYATKEGAGASKMALPVHSAIDFIHQLSKHDKLTTYYDIFRVFLSNEAFLGQITVGDKDNDLMYLVSSLYRNSQHIYQELPVNIYDKDYNKHRLMDHSDELRKLIGMIFYEDIYGKKKKNYFSGPELEKLKKECSDHLDRMVFIFGDKLGGKTLDVNQLKNASMALKIGTTNPGVIELASINGIGKGIIAKLLAIGIDSRKKLFSTPYSTLKRRRVGISEKRLKRLKNEYDGVYQSTTNDWF